MTLSDGTLRALMASEELRIDPAPRDEQIQPASIDLRLGSSFREFGPQATVLDPRKPGNYSVGAPLYADLDGAYLLRPGTFALGCTEETVGLSDALVARVEGKSSLGRLGLMVHSTAGFIDPGFHGRITLELFNLAPVAIKLWPGMLVCQLSVERLDRPAQRPYGSPGLRSHYQGQDGTTPAATDVPRRPCGHPRTLAVFYDANGPESDICLICATGG